MPCVSLQTIFPSSWTIRHLAGLTHPKAADFSFQGASMEITASDRQRFWSFVKRTPNCWEWIGCKNKKGYGWFYINGRPHTAQRISWIIHFGTITEPLCICHKCDNPGCVNPHHLFEGTNQENTADRHAKGRSKGPQGTKHAMAKLSDADIVSIRRSSLPSRTLGALYHVSKTQILRIKKGISWKHVSVD